MKRFCFRIVVKRNIDDDGHKGLVLDKVKFIVT